MATNEPASVPTDTVGEDTSGKQNAEEESQDAEVVLGPTDGDSDITTGSVSSESDYDSDELDDTVKTGDNFNIFIIVAVMGICGLMMIVIKSRKGTRIR
jgi:hypothetical protein